MELLITKTLTDNDIRYDTTEAGFTDNDNNGILGVSPVNVDLVGKVLGKEDTQLH